MFINSNCDLFLFQLQHHGLEISDDGQPLLVTLPKKRDIRAGQEGPIYLIPQLCYLTGLSDQLRADFRVMQDLAVHTRIGPVGRVERLEGFINELSGSVFSLVEERHCNSYIKQSWN